MKASYGHSICLGFEYLLSNYPEVFVIGQGLWAPWYVGNSMLELEKKFGKDRVLESPVSEAACTGVAIGASLCGYKAVVVHPRIDFMILAIDQIVTQAAKWNHMFGGQASPAVCFRGIVNRGGEQGAQHSQALHSWFAHIPGLRVVMPSTPSDARDLLIASVLDKGPVLYMDDRWLYEEEEEIVESIIPLSLKDQGPKVAISGDDITLVGAGYSTKLCKEAALKLSEKGISAEVIDLRIINPLDRSLIRESVLKTGRVVAIDGGWETCGLGGEIVSSVVEFLPPSALRASPLRIGIADAPAPTSKPLEALCYPTSDKIVQQVLDKFFTDNSKSKVA